VSASPAITSLNSGELSPLLAGRTDFNKYATGCSVLLNFIPTVQGPVTQRAGTRFVSSAKFSNRRAWLMRFEFNASVAYIVEFGHLYARFYTQHGRLMSGAVQAEVVTPYTEDDLFDSVGLCRLRYAQSGDVVYIAHPRYEPHTLKRVTPTQFTMDPFRPRFGPWDDLNARYRATLEGAIQDPNPAIVTASGTTGNVTLTATAPGLFNLIYVGRQLLLEAPNVSLVSPWEPVKAISAGSFRRVGSRV
jgi:hypothetical protein